MFEVIKQMTNRKRNNQLSNILENYYNLNRMINMMRWIVKIFYMSKKKNRRGWKPIILCHYFLWFKKITAYIKFIWKCFNFHHHVCMLSSSRGQRVSYSRRKNGRMIDITAEGFSLAFHLSFTCKQHWRQKGPLAPRLLLYSGFECLIFLCFALLATVLWAKSNNVCP